jgi:hypothetical protein
MTGQYRLPKAVLQEMGKHTDPWNQVEMHDLRLRLENKLALMKQSDETQPPRPSQPPRPLTPVQLVVSWVS